MKDNESWPHLVLLVIWPPVVTILVAACFWHFKVQPALDARPPVAVINVKQAMVHGMNGKTGVQALEASASHVQSAASRLSKQGYLVLQSRDVYAYPSEYRVKP